jgi:hypothetical protein
MRESGCEGVFLGIESGSARMLELMNKTARPHHYRRMIPLLKRAGIVTHANLIVGFPGETEASVLETLDLIEEAAPDFYRAQLWYADPTTPVWQQKETYGIRGSSFNWSHATMDADAAADWVEHLFCVVRNSLWLPQWSFETWSLFYLQRHGMTLAQIKTFVRCFNAAIKEKLIRPGRTEVSSGVLRTVRESCRYWTSRAPDLSSIERFDGYSQAYSYWCREGAMLPVAPRNRTTEHAPAEVTYEHVGTVRSRQPDNTESPPARFLAGLAAFAAQQEGGNDAYLFVGDSARDEVYPLRVVLAGCETISDAAAAVAAKLEEGRPHREFGLHCVRQVARRQLGGEPRVRFGVIERTQEGTNPGPTSLTTLLRERGWHDSPEWVLEMVRSDAAAELNIEIYGRKCQSLQTSGSQLLEILACSESQPDAVLSQEPFRLKNNLPTWREDALEEFQFSATE